MSSRFGGRSGSLFDDFFSDFFGDGQSGGPARPRRRPRHSGRSSASTSRSSSATRRANCCNARRRRPSNGAASTSTATHLLYAALCRTTSFGTCSGTDRRRSRSDRGRDRGGSRQGISGPTSRRRCRPTRKAALLAAYDESRELGSSYVGPEHVLLALARDDESEAGQLLQRFGVSHTKLRGRGHPRRRGQAAARARRARHRRSTSTAAT